MTGRLRMLAATLGAIAERESVTFIDALELQALKDVGAVLVLPESGEPRSMLFGRNLLLLSKYTEGGYIVDGEVYADVRLSREPELDRFQCDVDAEGVVP